jgi:CheY-like chemotaxis protein
MPTQSDMSKVVGWVKEIEELAGRFYEQAAKLFFEDAEFSEFLNQLAQDEKSHGEFMGMLSQHVRLQRVAPVSDIVFNPETRKRIESPFRAFEIDQTAKKISKQAMIQFLVEVELSEWNDIFLYVVEKFSEKSRKFQFMTAEIQAHQLRIQHFISSLPEALKPSLDISTLHPVWQSKFLVAEDEAALRNVIASLLQRKGVVETARDGGEGLEKVKQHFFSVIVSDINMPVMDGLEFYRRAVEYDPRMRQRFLVCSGEITPQTRTFLKENGIRFLPKPLEMGEFAQAIDDIVRESYKNM